MSADQAVRPSGVVTFLFTDVEGSTRRWEADGEGMRTALAAHDEVLRSAISTHGGWVFKHTGDGMCAAFTSPHSAVDAAIAAQRALELPVRMGIATGEAEARDGDYFGAVLNRAARVMSAGHGGQILVADSTAALISGTDLVDLGQRRLRDLPDPVGLFQVRGTGLRADFPPLRTLDRTPGNLKRQSSSFIGRETEVAALQESLRAHQLVTLTGVGGVGKTRLALEAAARSADEFTDGAWVFELAAVVDPAAIPDAVATVLGVTQTPGITLTEAIGTALEGRHRLLVFDNCEHLHAAAAEFIDAILAKSPTVKVMATSREGLGIADEQLWPVPVLDVSAGVDSPAVRLFVERACSVAPGFAVADTEDAGPVVEICRRLDGIPLAIELAASRMASMTGTEVRDRLDQRFRLLVGSRRGVAHHHTLRHAVGWSYDLLDEAERSLLTRCSVFSGGFDLQGAQAVTGSDLDDIAVLDLLDALVRKSLLVADRSSRRTRYSMLETIREFAEEQLVAGGAAEEVRTAHARYFAGCEADIMARWDGPDQRDTYSWFLTEMPNLRTAFRWAADQGDLDTAAAVAACAAFLGTWVEQYEPVAWVEELIAPAAEIHHRRLAQLYVVAAQCHAAGRVDDAVRYLDAGRQLVESGGYEAFPHGVHTMTGVVYTHAGRSERWVELCTEAMESGPGPHVIARACLVMALYFLGQRDEARAAAQGLIAAADSASNPNIACFSLVSYGLAYRDADPVGAYHALRRALAIAQESGNRQLESATAMSMWLLAAADDNPVNFFEYLNVAIRHYHDAGNVALLHNPLAILTAVLDRLGHLEQAATISGFAANEFVRAGYPQFTAAVNHLREVLGDPTYQALAQTGSAMTNAAMVTYAYDQIARARTQLERSR